MVKKKAGSLLCSKTDPLVCVYIKSSALSKQEVHSFMIDMKNKLFMPKVSGTTGREKASLKARKKEK